ncbi:hypothetical protein G9A89_003617 [Geosiphon pyriformis]|nr:hypothetical protein G9A89_003617 [Geosiphon pyriformis]
MSHDLDRILGELQQEVEELTADLERRTVTENLGTRPSSDSRSNNSSRRSSTKELSSDSDSDLLSLEDIEEEVVKIGSSLKKQPCIKPSRLTAHSSSLLIQKPTSSISSSCRSSTSSYTSFRNKLRRSVSPNLTNLQTSFLSQSNIMMDSSNSTSPKSVDTLSPLSPRGGNNLHGFGMDLAPLENLLNSSLPKDLAMTLTFNTGTLQHKFSSSGSPSTSLQSSPRLGPRQVMQQISDTDSNTSENSESEESDTDSDSDYNPLSLTSRSIRLKAQRSLTELAAKTADNSSLKRSISNGYKPSPSNNSTKNSPSSSSVGSTTTLNGPNSKIQRRPTTARGLIKSRSISSKSTNTKPKTPTVNGGPPPTSSFPPEFLEAPQRDRELKQGTRSPNRDGEYNSRDRSSSRSRERFSNDKENRKLISQKQRETEEGRRQRSRTREHAYEIQERVEPKTREREPDSSDKVRDRDREKNNKQERERIRDKSAERIRSQPQELGDDSDNNDLRQNLSRKTSRARETAQDRGRQRYKQSEKDSENSYRTKSTTREKEIQDDRGRKKYRAHEQNSKERARSRPKEVEPDLEKDKLMDRINGRSRDAEHTVSNRARSISRPPQSRDRNRSKSTTREKGMEERRERSKSKTRENEDRERVISKGRENDIDFEKERDLHLERIKNRGQDETEKSKQLDRAKSRRDKPKLAEGKTEKEESKIPEVKITARIYIDDSRQFKTLALTSKMNALNIIEYFRKRNAVEDGDEWTIFELVNEFGLERPIRDWEIVTTIIGSWEPKMSNALLLKKYAYRNSLTVEGLSNGVPPMFGLLHLEVKKNKWLKRYFFLRDGGIYHCKDAKGADSTFLCSIFNYDVYTLTRTIKKAPKPFVFALKSQDRVVMFENPEDYVHYLCADHMEKMKDWVLSIRTARNQMMRENNPELFSALAGSSDAMSPLSPQTPLTKGTSLQSLMTASTTDGQETGELTTFSSSESWASVRRFVRIPAGKNTGSKQIPDFSENSQTIFNPASDEEKKEGIAVFKSGSLLDYNEKNPPLKPVEPEQIGFSEGSLLASSDVFLESIKDKEKEKEKLANGGTLVQIDDNVKFHKGSLLEGRSRDHSEIVSSSSSTLVNIDDELRFHKGSLLAARSILSPGKDSFEITSGPGMEYNKGSLLARGLMSPGKDNFEITSPQSLEFNKGSLLARNLSSENSSHSNPRSRVERKPTNGPLISIDQTPTLHRNAPKITSPSTSVSPGKTFLQLDLNPDAQHTVNLRNKDFKPLLSFIPGEKLELPSNETEAMKAQREARDTGKPLLIFDNWNETVESTDEETEDDDTSDV